MKSWPNVATKQLQSRKKVQQKSRDIACKANFFFFIWHRHLKFMLQHPTVWFDLNQSKYPSKELLLYEFLHKKSTDVKHCDKERLQTTAFINVWKIFPGYSGDWFDVKTASTCTTELWDALKSFILDSLKIKVAPHPIIVSLDTLSKLYLKPRFCIWQMCHDPSRFTQMQATSPLQLCFCKQKKRSLIQSPMRAENWPRRRRTIPLRREKL